MNGALGSVLQALNADARLQPEQIIAALSSLALQWDGAAVHAYFESSPHGYEFVRLLGEAGEPALQRALLVALAHIMTVHGEDTARRVRNWAWALCRTHADVLSAVLKTTNVDLLASLVDFFASASVLDAGLAREIQAKFDFKSLAALLTSGTDSRGGSSKKRARGAPAPKPETLDKVRAAVLALVTAALECGDEACQRAALSCGLIAALPRALARLPDRAPRLVSALAACATRLLTPAPVLRLLHGVCLADARALQLLASALDSHPDAVAPALTSMLDPAAHADLAPLGLACARVLGADEFLRQSRLVLEPAPTPTWAAHAAFCSRVLDAPDARGGATADAALKAALPAALSRSTLSKGLMHASPLVRFFALHLLESLVRRAVRASRGLADAREHRLFVAEAARRLPDASVLVGLRAQAQASPQAARLWHRALVVLAAYFDLSPQLAEADVLKMIPRSSNGGGDNDGDNNEQEGAFGAWAVALCAFKSRPQPDDWLAGDPTALGALLQMGARFSDAAAVRDAVAFVACAALQDVGAVAAEPTALVAALPEAGASGVAVVAAHAKAVCRFALASPANAVHVDVLLKEFRRSGGAATLPRLDAPGSLATSSAEAAVEDRADALEALWASERFDVLERYVADAVATSPAVEALFVLRRAWETAPEACWLHPAALGMLARTAGARLDASADAAFVARYIDARARGLLAMPASILDAVVDTVAAVFPPALLPALAATSARCLGVALERDAAVLLLDGVLQRAPVESPAWARLCEAGRAMDLALALCAAPAATVDALPDALLRRLALCPGVAARAWVRRCSMRGDGWTPEDYAAASRSAAGECRRLVRTMASALAGDDDAVAAARFDPAGDAAREALVRAGASHLLLHAKATAAALALLVVSSGDDGGGDDAEEEDDDAGMRALDAALDRGLADVAVRASGRRLSQRAVRAVELALRTESSTLLLAVGHAGVPAHVARAVQGKLVGWRDFADVMLRKRVATAAGNDDAALKLGACRLLLACASAEPAKCASRALLPLLLAAFGCTQSPSDAALRGVLRIYEAQGVGPTLTGYAFGPWVHADVLTQPSALVPEAGQAGALLEQHGAWIFEAWNEAKTRGDGDVDAGYVLECVDFHLGLHALAAQNEVRDHEFATRQWLVSGLVGLAVRHTADEDAHTRRLAFGCVRRFAQLASRAGGFRERAELVLLLNAFRQGVPEPFAQVPGIVASFVEEALRVIARGAQHPMWDVVVAHVVKKPALDLHDIPLFYTLLYSGSPRFESERAWLLKVLCRGMRGPADAALLARRHVVDAVLCLVDSPAGDPAARALVMRLLQRTADVAADGRRLLVRAGVAPWAVGVLREQHAGDAASPVWAWADSRKVDTAALAVGASRLLASLRVRGAVAEQWALALSGVPDDAAVGAGVAGLLASGARLSLEALAALVRRGQGGALLDLVLASELQGAGGDGDWSLVLAYALGADCARAAAWMASSPAHWAAAGRLLPVDALVALLDGERGVDVRCAHRLLASALLEREPASSFARRARDELVPALLGATAQGSERGDDDVLGVLLCEALRGGDGSCYQAMHISVC